MVKRRILLTDGYLHFPLNDTGEKKYVEIMDVEQKLLAEFHMGVLQEEPYSYYPLKLHGMAGKTVEICCREDVPEEYLECILVGGAVEDHPELYPNIYKEPERQQIHFSSRRGWLNDPNGLVYTDGKYHMCYQHNPLGNRHGGVNISWGLTVSDDGVHYLEYPDAIYPSDSKTHIASGSAIVDIDNISGKGKGCILATYTALESSRFDERESVGTRGQILVYSTDGGYTFKPFPDNPIIPVPEGCDWRDPKILRLDDGSLCIAVYETYDGRNCVSFYSSADCINWKFESRTMDLFECPDLFRLPVQGTGEFLWVLYGANGMYRVGTFENYRFRQIGESMWLDYGSATYAGQTYNSHPDTDGRYHIAWMNEEVWKEEKPSAIPYSQSMTVLCRFTLHKTQDGYRLFRNPIQALDSLRMEPENNWQLCMPDNQNTTHQLPVPGETWLMVQGGKTVQVAVNGHGFTYDPVAKHLLFSSGKEYTLTSSKPFTVRIITDIRSIEFFICEEISATYISVDPQKVLNITGEDVQVQSRMWKMQGIWKEST